jgi:hypothetical protein
MRHSAQCSVPQCAIRRGLDFRYNCRLQLQTERQAKLEWAKERDHAHVSQLAVRNGSSRALLNVQSPTHRAHSSACAHVHTIVRAQRMPLRVAVTSCACVCPQHVPRPVVPVPPTSVPMCFSRGRLQRDVEVLRNRIAELQAEVRAPCPLCAALRVPPMCT